MKAPLLPFSFATHTFPHRTIQTGYLRPNGNKGLLLEEYNSMFQVSPMLSNEVLYLTARSRGVAEGPPCASAYYS